MTRQWPLVGRHVQLAQVIDHLRSPGDRSSVVIAGPAGVGKTRLADDAVARVADGSWVVERVTATQTASTIAFAPFVHLLRAPAPHEELQLLQQVREALLHRAGPRRLLLVVDDAHLLDPGSATLLHQLVAQNLVTVLITVRTGERAPDSLRALWKDELASWVELGNLPHAATDELLTAALGGRVEPRTRQQLWDISRGNPLILRELVVGALDDGALVDGSMWRLTGPLTPSTRLREIVRARLQRLDDAGHAAVELLALCDPLPLEVLRDVAGDGAVASLEDAGIARVEVSGRRIDVVLWRPVHAEVVRDDLGEARRRSRAAQLAAAIKATGAERGEDRLRLSVLALEAGPPFDGLVLADGAIHALASSRHEIAERLARAALDVGHATFDTSVVLATALAGQNRADDAERTFRDASRLARGEHEEVRLALARAQNLLYGLRRPHDASELLQRTREGVTDRDHDDELTAMLAVFATLSGDARTGIEAGRRVLDRPPGHPRPAVATLVASTVCQFLLGELDDIERALDIGMRLAAEVEDELPLATTQLAVTLAAVDWVNGRVLEARQRCREAYRIALERGEDDLAAVWAAFTAQLLSFGASPHDTLPIALEAVELLREHDVLGLLPMALGCGIQAAAHVGDMQVAQRLAEDEAVAAAESELRGAVFIARGRAWIRAASGDRRAAAEELAAVGQTVIDGGVRIFGAVALHDVVRLGYPELVAPRLISASASMDGLLPGLWAMHARALAGGDAVELERVASGFAERGMPLYAAEAATQAAQEHQRQGRQRTARRAAARAASWHAAELAPVTASPVHLQLTRRELEIATMAAHGLTSPQIARALVISQRTVDNHLRSVYSKLGIAGRRDLGSVLPQRG